MHFPFYFSIMINFKQLLRDLYEICILFKLNNIFRTPSDYFERENDVAGRKRKNSESVIKI